MKGGLRCVLRKLRRWVWLDLGESKRVSVGRGVEETSGGDGRGGFGIGGGGVGGIGCNKGMVFGNLLLLIISLALVLLSQMS